MKISFHPESADIETIVNLAVMIKDAGGDVEIRAMLMKNLFHKVGQLEQELLKHNIPTVKLPVFPLYNKQTKTFNQPYESSRYLKGYKQSIGNDGYFTNEELIQLDNLKDNTQDYLPDVLLDDKRMPLSKFIAKGMNRFQGWQCEVVKRKLLIEADGRMKHGVCGNEGVIGNIFTDDVPPFKNTTTTCLQEQCHVAEEVMITKFYA